MALVTPTSGRASTPASLQPTDEGGWGVVFEVDRDSHPVPTIAVIPRPGALHRVSMKLSQAGVAVHEEELSTFEASTNDAVLFDLPEFADLRSTVGLLLVWVTIEDPESGAAWDRHQDEVYVASVDGAVTLWTPTQALAELERPATVSLQAVTVTKDLSRNVITEPAEEGMVEEPTVEDGLFGWEVTP